MRLRIEDGTLGFKMTEAELNQLVDGQPLCIHALLTVNLIPLQTGESDLVFKEGVLDLLLGPQHLGTLVDIGKNRAGVSIEFSDLTAVLQVDIRSDNRVPCQA